MLARHDRAGARPGQPAALGELGGEQRGAVFRADDAVGRELGQLVEQRSRVDRSRRRDPVRRTARGSCSNVQRDGRVPADRRRGSHPPIANLDSRLHARNRRGNGRCEGAHSRRARGRAGPDDGAARAVLRRGADPAGLSAHVSARLGPRAHRALRGAVDLPAARRREADLPRRRRHLRRVRPRAGGAALARAARPHRRAHVPRRGPRAVAGGARRDRARLGRPAAPRRLRLRPRRAARAAARRDDAADDPALRPRARGRAAASADGRPGRSARRGRVVRHGHGRRALGLRQRASRPRGRDRRVQDRRRAGVERRLRRVPRRRRLGRAAALVGAGRRRVGALLLRARRAGAAQRARAARLLGGGGRVRPVGGQAAADGSRVGAGREARRAARRGLGLGVDVVGLRRLPGLPARSRTPSTPRCSSAPSYKVLRGASWATSPTVSRVTFRNWDFPIRRQIFAGFRCASDV